MASVDNLLFFRMNFHFRLHVGLKKKQMTATGLNRFRNLMNRYFLLNLTLNFIFYLLRNNRSAQRIIVVTYIYLFDEYFYPFIITRIIFPLHTELSCILERQLVVSYHIHFVPSISYHVNIVLLTGCFCIGPGIDLRLAELALRAEGQYC